MSDAASDAVRRPTSDDDREGWKHYWAQTQPREWLERWGYWRTEPEIDEARQRFLAGRRAVQPDVETGIYPFRDESGPIKLTRADVEWLLATHVYEGDGTVGPIVWNAEQCKPPEERCWGLDVRGADLSDLNLDGLPLSCLRAGLTIPEGTSTTRRKRRLAVPDLRNSDLYGAHLEGAHLSRVYLEGADLQTAHLTQADLFGAHLEGALLSQAHLEGAMLARAFFDASVYFLHTSLASAEDGAAYVADVRWNGVSLATVEWAELHMLGDEQKARRSCTSLGKQKDPSRRREEYETAVRANRQFAIALREQGLNEHADHFAYRAQLCQSEVFRRQGVKKWPAYLGSLLLWALAGYGYRLWRIFAAYGLVVALFAVFFFVAGIPNDPAKTMPGHAWDALLVSLTAIHGRVFFEQIGFSARGWLAAIESVVGIVIEGIFVAMIIQRWFQR